LVKLLEKLEQNFSANIFTQIFGNKLFGKHSGKLFSKQFREKLLKTKFFWQRFLRKLCKQKLLTHFRKNF
jgi:hypothetical protein